MEEDDKTMKKRMDLNLFLIVLLMGASLGVSSCPEKKVPPTTPPEPGAISLLEADFFSKRGVFPGNAPLTGPGFFFFRMLA